MKENKMIFMSAKPFQKTALAVITILLIAVFLTSCAPPLVQSNPTPQPVLQSTPTVIDDQTGVVTTAAKSALAEQLKIGTDAIQLVDIESVQWPDSCLGVQQAGIMCAMHVVDGYRVSLSVNDQAYETRSNLDGSQIVVVPGPVPTSAGISFTVRTSNQCQTFLFNKDQDVMYGPCNGTLEKTPFVETARALELNHFLTTYQSFTMDMPSESMNFVGTGDTHASDIEQRSIVAWAQLVADETQAGRSSAASGLVIGWHREGGLAGFCDDLAVYATGAVNTSSCRNGQAENLGQTWLDTDQLTQLYHWIDGLKRFEYAPKTDAVADAMLTTLVFAGQGSTPASETDQQAIAAFAEDLFTQNSSMGVLSNPNDAAN